MILHEWEYKQLDEADGILTDFIPSFIAYLSQIWQERNKYVESEEDLSEEEKQERKIQKQRFFDFTLDGKISARNYVGIVQHNGVRIQVIPKIFSKSEIVEEKKWGIHLLYWLSYCKKFKFPFSTADISNVDFEDFLELLISVFANYTENVVSNQPFQAYHEVQEEHSYLKGRLLFDEYIRHNLITARRHLFYIAHEPLEYDNGFNRIIKFVSSRLLALSRNSYNKSKLESILFLMHDVSDVLCSAEDCEKVKLNPLFTEYIQILELCKMFLSNQFIDLQENNSDNFCFLVPMEYVFEDFIFGFLDQHWPNSKIKSQSTTYLAKRDGLDVFKIKNDIVIDKHLIVDTKYKLRSISKDNKAGVCQSDMYQMISYALRRNCDNVMLLYPLVANCNNEEVKFNVDADRLHSSIEIAVKSLDITFTSLLTADSILYDRFKDILEDFL